MCNNKSSRPITLWSLNFRNLDASTPRSQKILGDRGHQEQRIRELRLKTKHKSLNFRARTWGPMVLDPNTNLRVSVAHPHDQDRFLCRSLTLSNRREDG